MNVGQEELNQWRRTAGQLRVTCREVLACLHSGKIIRGREVAEQAEDQARRLALRLEKAGADRPDSPPPSLTEGVPLHLLNTPANRRLLSLLRETYEAALAVDRERYGESIGTDGCARSLKAYWRMSSKRSGGRWGWCGNEVTGKIYCGGRSSISSCLF